MKILESRRAFLSYLDAHAFYILKVNIDILNLMITRCILNIISFKRQVRCLKIKAKTFIHFFGYNRKNIYIYIFKFKHDYNPQLIIFQMLNQSNTPSMLLYLV